MWFYLIFSKTLQGRECTESLKPTMFIQVVISELCKPRWQQKTSPCKLWLLDPLLISFSPCRSLLTKQGKLSPRKDPSALSCQPRCHRQCTWPRSKGATALQQTWKSRRRIRAETSACPAWLPVLLVVCWGAVRPPSQKAEPCSHELSPSPQPRSLFSFLTGAFPSHQSALNSGENSSCLRLTQFHENINLLLLLH